MAIPSINLYTPCLVVSSTLVKHGLLYSSSKEGCYRWLENGILVISSRVKMAIRNCFAPWRIKMFLPVLLLPCLGVAGWGLY